jgi:hypothetical protein
MDGKSVGLAEAARRLLRSEASVLAVPERLRREALDLALAISDGIPKMIREPTILTGASAVGVAGLFQLGGDAPALEVCWVPGSVEELWPRWVRQVTDLIAAGYPGCVGCGGPGSEGPWVELASRALTRANAGVTK